MLKILQATTPWSISALVNVDNLVGASLVVSPRSGIDDYGEEGR